MNERIIAFIVLSGNKGPLCRFWHIAIELGFKSSAQRHTDSQFCNVKPKSLVPLVMMWSIALMHFKIVDHRLRVHTLMSQLQSHPPIAELLIPNSSRDLSSIMPFLHNTLFQLHTIYTLNTALAPYRGKKCINHDGKLLLRLKRRSIGSAGARAVSVMPP